MSDAPIPDAEPLTVDVPGQGTVSALWLAPAPVRATYVFAHGAGAGMHHGFMAGLSADLAAEGVATLRFQFPYVERGSKRPDSPAVAQAAVRAAVALAARRTPASTPLFAGGKSYGGRMTSGAQAAAKLERVRGLAFVGFPLHPAGEPSRERAAHLAKVEVPMLFLQGTRDELADMGLLKEVLAELGDRARLVVIDDADHSFHVRAKVSGTNDAAVRRRLAAEMAGWFVA